MSKRSDPICFRMDQEDYKKFAVYVDDTDLSESKIAERAVTDYVTENTTTLKDKIGGTVSLALASGLPALYVYGGAYQFAAVIIAIFALVPFYGPYIDSFTDAVRSGVRAGFNSLKT